MPNPLFSAARATWQRLFDQISHTMLGQDMVLRKLLAAFAAGGHVLLEDVPGTGKTTLAKTLALTIGADFKRVQFTPDLLPSDILGLSMYEAATQRFEFHPGPIFTQILLADEINRAAPRTQSALLEAMAESQVSIDGRQYPMDDLFFVLATQNPVEFHGTYPLPEAQMDRFALKLSMGYMDAETEAAMVEARHGGEDWSRIQPCVTQQEVRQLRQAVQQVQVAPELTRYAVALVRATRNQPEVQLGAGPRASLALVRCAKALALADGMDYITPDHLQTLAQDVLAHRLVLSNQVKYNGTNASQLVTQILHETAVPA